MQIVTVSFNSQAGNCHDYLLLKNVFRKSCEVNMPDAEFIDYVIDAPEKEYGHAYNFTYNTIKLRIWRDHLKAAKENIIFADCDMLCTKDASSGFDLPFDIAYTSRTTVVRIPMNGGIIFARPTDKAVQFLEKWSEINDRMYNDLDFHHQYRVQWAGMNQAAFGYLMEHPEEYDAKLHEYFTQEWNAVDCDWGRVDHNTKFIHYKSSLRKLVLRKCPPSAKYKTAIIKWNEMRHRLKMEDGI